MNSVSASLVMGGASKKFVEETVEGMGALKGSPATVKEYTFDETTGDTIVTFEWEDVDHLKHTEDVIVKRGNDGIPGEQGVGIVSITKTSTVGLVDTYTILFTDDTTTTFNVTNGEGGESSSDMDLLKREINENWLYNGYNLLPYPYPNNSETINGIYYDVSGTGGPGSVLINGTATGVSEYVIGEYVYVRKEGIYRFINECDSYIFDVTNSKIVGYNNENVELTPYSSYNIVFKIETGVTFDQLLCYPMLVEVDSNGKYPTEYQRYSLGNRYLTDEFYKIKNSIPKFLYNKYIVEPESDSNISPFTHSAEVNLSSAIKDDTILSVLLVPSNQNSNAIAFFDQAFQKLIIHSTSSDRIEAYVKYISAGGK